MPRQLKNFIAFQVGWFGCVLSAANGLPLLGVLIAGVVVAAHVRSSQTPRDALKLVGLAVVLGTLCDSLLLMPGWLGYAVGQPLSAIAPYWIIAMWAMFATTLDASLAWLQRSRLLAAVGGALFAPIAYWAGARMGAIELLDPRPALIAIGVTWALVLPVLTHAARVLSSSTAQQRITTRRALASHA